MGNTESSGATANIVTGLKKAQAEKDNPLYQLVDYEGGGELLQWMKYALSSGDYNIFDGYVEHKVRIVGFLMPMPIWSIPGSNKQVKGPYFRSPSSCMVVAKESW